MKKRDKKNSRFITVLFSRLPCGTRRRKSLENKTVINLEFFLSLFFILLFPQTLKRSNIITGFLLPFFFSYSYLFILAFFTPLQTFRSRHLFFPRTLVQ